MVSPQVQKTDLLCITWSCIRHCSFCHEWRRFCSYVQYLPRLHSAPIPGSNPGGGSDPSCGVSLTRVYTVIPLKEQTPQAGQIERAQVRNFSWYTWKSSIHCAGKTSFLFTHAKKAESDPACGVEPYKLGGAQKAGQTPQSGQVICVYTEGQKAGSDSSSGVQPRNRSTV